MIGKGNRFSYLMEQSVHYCTITSSGTAFAHIMTVAGTTYLFGMCSSAHTEVFSRPLALVSSCCHAIGEKRRTCTTWLFHLLSQQVMGTVKRFLARPTSSSSRKLLASFRKTRCRLRLITYFSLKERWRTLCASQRSTPFY